MKKKYQIKSLNSHISNHIFFITLCSFFIFLFPLVLSSQTPTLYGPPGSRTIDLYVNEKDPSIIFSSNYEGGLFFNSEAIKTQQNFAHITKIFFSKTTGKLFFYADHRFISGNISQLNWKLIYDDTGYEPRVKNFIVNPLNENVIYMHRHGSEIWSSNDNGENWFLLHTFDDDIGLLTIAPSDSSILYATQGRDLYKSIDSGNNWFIPFTIPFAFDAWQLKVNPQNPHSVYLQSGGKLYKAMGGGNNIDTTVISNLSDFIVDPKDTLVMYVAASDPWFGTGGGMMKSTDGGENWFSIINGLPYNGTTVRKLAIDPINTNILYAGTNTRGVYKTTDGGEKWEITNLVNDGDIKNYEIIDSKKGEIISLSYGWHLIKTTNNGSTWSKPEFLPSENNYKVLKHSLTFNPDNKQIGYHGDGTDLFKTTDGGTTWNKTEHVPTCKMVVYHPFNPNIIYAKAESDMLYISEDGGSAWRSLEVREIPSVFSAEDDNVAYYYTHDKIGKTTDMGQSWTIYQEGLPTDYQDGQYWIKPITSVAINNSSPNILYLGQMSLHVSPGALAKSTDGGESWFQVDSALAELDPFISVHSVCIDQDNPQRIFVGLRYQGWPFSDNFSNGALYLTEDDCKTWRKLYDSYTDNIKIDYTTTPKTIYFTSKFGLMSLPDTAHVTDVDQTKPVLPKKFVLEQNYPNPFNPSTTIKYEIPDQVRNDRSKVGSENFQSVQLIVYDVLGREITTLVNEHQKPGNYEVEFQASDLPSGIYFYKLQSNTYIQVKKMLLLK